MSDYMPFSDARILEWIKNLIAYLEANLARLGIDAATLTALKALLALFEAAYEKTGLPETSRLDTATKNAAKEELRSAIRDFVNSYIRYNKAVTDVDRMGMGLPIPDKKPTPTPPPTTAPLIELRLARIRQVIVAFKNEGSKKWGKPVGVHGAEIRWAVRDQRDVKDPPVEPTDLANSSFATKSPHTMEFSGAERGQTLDLCLRWENNVGDKGPWGEISSAIIP
ncbi:MAG: hypothetical protein LBK25_06500 [Treponema sp.]|jgi:hypothetical protein|nr:hypothetical protein [Treponema sp.]